MTPQEAEEWASQVEEQTFGFSEVAIKELSLQQMADWAKAWETSGFNDKVIAARIRQKFGEGE